MSSGAVEVASLAPQVIEELIADIIRNGWANNEIALGELEYLEDTYQVQLKVTLDPNEFLVGD